MEKKQMIFVLVVIAILLAIIVFGEGVFTLASFAIGAIIFVAICLFVVFVVSGVVDSYGFYGILGIIVTLFFALSLYQYGKIISEFGSLRLWFEKCRALLLPEKNAELLRNKVSLLNNIDIKIAAFKKAKSEKIQNLVQSKFSEIEQIVKIKLEAFIPSDDINFNRSGSITYVNICGRNLAEIYLSEDLNITMRLKTSKSYELYQKPAHVADAILREMKKQIKSDPSIIASR